MPGEARGVNVNEALPALTDESGGRAWLAAKADLKPTGRFQRLPFTQGTDNKRKRRVAKLLSRIQLKKPELRPVRALTELLSH